MDHILASAPTWDEILADAPESPPPVNREEDERTTADLARMLGKTHSQAERWAKKQVVAGVLEQVKRWEKSRIVNAWCPVPPSDNGPGHSNE